MTPFANSPIGTDTNIAATPTNTKEPIMNLPAGSAVIVDEVPVVQLPPDTIVKSEMAANLVLLSFSVRRPTGRVMVKNAEVNVGTDDNSEKVTIGDKKKMTNPQWRADIHPGWAALEKNATRIESILNRYSVSDVRRGNRLISGGAIGQCLSELAEARNERKQITLTMLYDVWESEVIPGIVDAFPQHHKQILHSFIPKGRLVDACDVDWQIQPLTPLNPEQLDLTKLNTDDRLKVVKQSNEMIQKAANSQVELIVNKVAGDVVALCDEINSGTLETGRKKSGFLPDMLAMLERLTHFQQFMNPQVLAAAKIASEKIKGFSYKQLNAMPSVQQAIKEIMQPLGDSLKSLQADYAAGTGPAVMKRSVRSLL
jgi:hypothetical protein